MSWWKIILASSCLLFIISLGLGLVIFYFREKSLRDDETTILVSPSPELTPMETEIIEEDLTVSDSGVSSKPIEENQWQLLAKAELPLYKVDYYTGKYENALAGAKQINKIGTIKNSKAKALLGDGIISLTASNGYVNTSKGFAFGVCWPVTALGYAQDRANRAFKEQYGVNLYQFPQRYGHSKWYKTYAKVNNGYGYAIYMGTTGPIKEYTFKINPKALKKYPNLEVKHKVVSYSDPQAYKNLSFRGKVWVKFDTN